MSNPSRLEPWLSISQLLANGMVVAGVGLAIYTLAVQRHDLTLAQKRTAAMEFVMVQYEEPLLEATSSIADAFAIEGRKEILLGNQEADKLELIEQISLEEIGLSKLKMVADLYRSVITCVEAEICDRQIIEHVYRQDIEIFYCQNKDFGLPRIAARMNDKTYAEPLRKYAGQCVNPLVAAKSPSRAP
jgi:hypothetical protein